MRAIIAPKEMSLIGSQHRANGQSIGLVPTMGALHEGHLSLVRQSVEENDVTIASIFVNPLQFNNEEDFTNYPVSIDSDLESLKTAGVDYVFQPSPQEFYPERPKVSISFGEMEKTLEGEFRPGHFSGVGIVVSKLFHIVHPDRSYFGLKDLQQFLLIKRMVKDLAFQTEVVGVQTVREQSGLAMSSRNLRLSQNGKEVASQIFKSLQIAEDLIAQRKNLKDVKNAAASFLKSVNGIDLEYLEIVNGATLQAVQSYDGLDELAVCFAGYVEGVRLIDNLYLRLK